MMTASMRKPNADSLLNDAIKEARLAYRFNPDSYTNGALSALLNAAYYTEPDWIAEFLDYTASMTDIAPAAVGKVAA
jgi:hypothetical protein